MASDDLSRLLQRELRLVIESSFTNAARIPVYHFYRNGGIFCALVPNANLATCLANDSWELTAHHIGPGCSVSYAKGGETVTYSRFSRDDDIEPFVIPRSFHGMRDDYVELLEEFRLFLNLYHDADRRVFLRFDESGDEHEVAWVSEEGSLEVDRHALRQFLAIKDMSLLVYFDTIANSNLSLSEVPEAERSVTSTTTDYCYSLVVVDEERRSDEGKTYSRLLGKTAIRGLPKEDCGIWPYKKGKSEYTSFIIGQDGDGKELLSTCDPEALDHPFGKNTGTADYLSSVYFRPEVLRKYYENPDKYSVEDGLLRCGGLWCMRIDNGNADYVIAFLGDLGRDLPANDRLHWRAYNIFPAGPMSGVAFKRGFLAEPSAPEKPDLLFKYRYVYFGQDWVRAIGWPLFQAPHEDDQHLLTVLRMPLNDAQPEFDEQVLILTKLLVDYLNEKAIAKGLTIPPDTKGISKFELFLKAKGYPDPAAVVGFLRDLQALRSTGAAHRKSSQYKETLKRLGIEQKTKRAAFEGLLRRAIQFLDGLTVHFLKVCDEGLSGPGDSGTDPAASAGKD